MISDIVKREHREYVEHARGWRWLQDSYEGGDRYRWAEYGLDEWGYPRRNLVRHKREYDLQRDGDPKLRTTEQAGGDFETRLLRTPVPTLVQDVVDDHLRRVFAREVTRTGPAALASWWENVDGRGTRVDDWMREQAGPTFYTLGQIDVLVDLPRPTGPVRTEADVRAQRLNAPLVRVVDPCDIPWWKLSQDGTYTEVLVREYVEEPDGKVKLQYRHWTPEAWALYDDKGELQAQAPHSYGVVPMRRYFVRRKVRCGNVGLSPLVNAAERQREVYNRDSELVLSDTQQAHPLLQGPEDFVQPDGTVPIGPSWLLPKKKTTGASGATYEGFDVVSFPSEGAESLRANIRRYQDEVDRKYAQAKPAGESGTGSGTVSQSGVSKAFDAAVLNNLLTGLADSLARLERGVADLVWRVMGNASEPPGLDVSYPKQFALYDAPQLAAMAADFQATLEAAGSAPIAEQSMLMQMVVLMLPGLPDAEYQQIRQEIEAFIGVKAAAKLRDLLNPPEQASNQRQGGSEDEGEDADVPADVPTT